MKLTKYPFNGRWRVEMVGTIDEIDSYLIRLYNIGATNATFERDQLETFFHIDLEKKRWEKALSGWLQIQNAENETRKLCRIAQKQRRDKIPIYSQVMQRLAQEEIAAIPIPEIKSAVLSLKNHDYKGISYIVGTDHEAEMMSKETEIPAKINVKKMTARNFSCNATASE